MKKTTPRTVLVNDVDGNVVRILEHDIDAGNDSEILYTPEARARLARGRIRGYDAADERGE